jgi:hypothetical protein
MRTMKLFGAVAILLLFAASEASAAAKPGAAGRRVPVPRRAAKTIDNNDRLAVNLLDMYVTNHGSLAYDLQNSASGLFYPRGTLKTAVYAAGLWIGAKAYGPTDTIGISIPSLRVAVGEYSQEFTPGPMVDPLTGGPCTSGCVPVADNPTFRNFRFDRAHPLTGADRTDYLAQGGPIDSLGNPQLIGDAMIWSVFNDADQGVHTNRAGSTPPLGIEVQQSVFAFARSGALGNIIFVKWKFINKGVNTLDSTFVSVWSDPDLGGAGDDLVGCDTTLSLGFCYNDTNTDQLYGATPPAVGFDFFKGPTVGGNPLGMSSFNKYINGTDPSSQVETYNYMRGLNKDGSPVHVLDVISNPITRFQVSGLDPRGASTASNWLDSNANDRRLMLSSGPFTMAPGDTQEVVTAVIIGQGQDRYASIDDMKNKDSAAQAVFDLNFDIPEPPPAPVVFAQPLDKAVRLIWDASAVGTHSFSDTLNQDFVFEGYRVWQLPSAGSTGTAKVIATYDVAGNDIGPIYSDLFNSDKGAIERTLVIAGNDEGLRFQIDITSDAIRGGPLVNYKDYYFAVTAFAYDSMNTQAYMDLQGVNQLGVISEVLESGLNVVQVEPRGSNAVFSIQANQIAGDPVGNRVVVEQLQGTAITDSTYQVVFAPDQSWSLINVTSGDTLLTNQTSVSGGFDSPIINGFMTRVIGTTDPSSAFQLVGGSGLLGAADSIDLFPGDPDSSGTYILTNFVDPSDITWWNFNDTVQHDYLIHVLPDTTQFAWDYNFGDPSPQATFKVPFEIYDLGECSYANPSDDVKVSVMVRDLDGNGSWSWGDAIYIRLIPYASVPWGTPGITSDSYTPDDLASQTLGRLTFDVAEGSTATLPVEGRIRIRSGKFCPNDVFQFRTVPSGSAPGTVVQNDLKRILAVPNPYYAHSQYELTQFNRVLKFTNIPASRQVTIRIFNLAGDLVRTIRRSAASGDDMSSAQITWDLNTNRNLPVASGIYIARIDVDGVGSKTLRVAIFVEQERLDNF